MNRSQKSYKIFARTNGLKKSQKRIKPLEAVDSDSNAMEGTEQLHLAMSAIAKTRLERMEGGDPVEYQKQQDGPITVQYTPKEISSFNLIIDCLSDNLLFKEFSRDKLEMIAHAMKPKKIKKGDTPIVKGGHGFGFYVIVTGKFCFLDGGGKKMGDIKEVSSGECFGELSLLFSSPRSVTVKCIENAEVYFLRREIFRGILDLEGTRRINNITAVLQEHSSLCKDFSPEKIESIAKAGHLQALEKGQLIIKKGDTKLFFYFVISGVVEVQRAGDDDEEDNVALEATRFKQGDYFGEVAFIKNEPRTADVVAVERCELLVLDKSAVNDFIVKGNKEILRSLDENYESRILRSVQLFNLLTESAFEDLKQNLRLRSYKRGDELITQGKPGEKFYVIKSGTVEVHRKQDGQTTNYYLGRGRYFGHIAFIEDTEPNATVKVDSDEADIFVLDKEHFENIFTRSKEPDTKPTRKTRRERITEIVREKGDKFDYNGLTQERNPSFRMRLRDLEVIAIIGSGGFGSVSMVKHKGTNEEFALKQVSKHDLRPKQYDQIMNEKKIMLSCDHPFIVKLHRTFQDAGYLYFMMDLVRGNDMTALLFVVHADDPMSEDAARFYVGSIVEVFGYLHQQSIIYRDLKPENVMLDQDGYVKLIDFGFSKVLSGRTKTECGTLEYMAPELLINQSNGHDRAVDLWALGVFTFEVTTSTPAFSKKRGTEDKDDVRIFRSIVKGKYKKKALDKLPLVQNLVESLLQKQPFKRLGMGGDNTEDIKKHPWFKDAGFNFDDLRRKDMEPPFIPPEAEYSDAGTSLPSRTTRESLTVHPWLKDF